jgi:hypothetical protein
MMRAPRQYLYLYGDPAYYCTFGVRAPFMTTSLGGRRNLTVGQQRFNEKLASIWISVEHVFGDAWRKWTYTMSHKQLRSGSQAVGVFFRFAVLLNNCRACIPGRDPTSDRFKVKPPTLEEYLYPDFP